MSSTQTTAGGPEPSSPQTTRPPRVRTFRRTIRSEAERQERVLSVYILVRLLIGLGLLALSLRTLMDQPSVREELSGPFAVAALMFLAMGLSAATVRRYARAAWFAWIQVTIDGLFASILVSMTGGPVSPLFPLFFLNVIAATFVLPGRGAVVVAGIDLVLYIVLLNTIGLTGLSTIMGGDLLLNYSQILLQVFAFLLVGMLSSVLSGNLRATRRALARQVAETEVLRARHDLILEQVDAGVLVLDPTERIESQNPSARRLLGGVVGRRVDTVLAVNGSSWEELYQSGSEMRSLLCSRSALEGGGSVVFIEDVTRLREMEAVVARKERLSAVGRLAAGLAHEIRNPLASLSGSVQLLRDEGRSPLHDIVLREVKRLNELVDEFLDSARPVRLSIEMVNPGDIIGDVSTAFRNDPRYHGRRVLRARASRLPDVMMDGARFRQVIWNLLLNAAQATPDYGSISIECGVEGDHLRVDIADDGVGIDPVALRRIFDPFYTTRSGGTGLGLANVERIVRAHDGTINVESTPGEGTSFTIRLPLGGPETIQSPESS